MIQDLKGYCMYDDACVLKLIHVKDIIFWEKIYYIIFKCLLFFHGAPVVTITDMLSTTFCT